MGNNIPKEPLSKKASDNEELEALNALLLHEPNNIEAVKKRAIAKYRLRDYQGALEDFNKVVDSNPSDVYVLQYRGATKHWLGDYRGALEDFNTANEIEPDDYFTLRGRASAKKELGDEEGALEDYNRADRIESALIVREGEKKLMERDYQGALEALDTADWILPSNAYTLCYRGMTKRLLEDYEGALEDLNRADEIQPNNVLTLKNRSMVRYCLNDLSKAHDDIIRALEQSPDDEALVDWKNIVEMEMKKTESDSTSISASTSLPVVAEGVIQVPFSDLQVIKTLGEGGFGEVSLAEWSGIEVALKKFKPNVVVADADMSHEAKTLMRLRYKFIVTLMGITTDPQTSGTVLIMEYMRHGSLEDLLFKQHVKLSRASVIRLALDIALGVNYLHSQNPKVLHRDLKSANVLLHRNKTRANIADFGTAKFLHSDVQTFSAVGSFSIAMPPEMIAEEKYDEKIDVFSFGVVLYEMLTNKRLAQLEEIHRVKRIRESIDDTPLMQLVMNCCATDPTKRPHMRDIIELLRKMKNESK